MRLEDPGLVGRAQSAVERQDLARHAAVVARQGAALQQLGDLADLAFGGDEHERVALPFAADVLDRRDEVPLRVALGLALLVRLRRAVADFDRIGPALDGDDRGRRAVRGEEFGEALHVDRGAGDDHPQVGPPGHQAFQRAEQQVDVEAPLVGLVDDDRVVGVEEAVPLRLGEQDAVGHQLDAGRRRRRVGEADLEPDLLPERHLQFLRDPRRDAAGGDPPRLRVPDDAPDPAADRQGDLRQLRAFPRPRLAAQDDDRIVADRRRHLVDPLMDRQVARERDGRPVTGPRGEQLGGPFDLAGESDEIAVKGLAGLRRLPHRAELAAKPRPVGRHRLGDPDVEFVKRGHRDGKASGGRQPPETNERQARNYSRSSRGENRPQRTPRSSGRDERFSS